MRAAGQADCFVVINGPEDGTEHPIVRAPLYVGSDATCGIAIRLDKDVGSRHAFVTVVSEGYRFRSVEGDPIFVDGKRAGPFRSRIARHGGVVQIGHTLLAIDCAPDGLAQRSRGIVSESDFGWAAQIAARNGWNLLLRSVAIFGHLLRHLLTSWLAIAAVLFLLYVLWPRFNAWVDYGLWWLIDRIRSVL
jgi:hypothetical protein